MEEKDRFIVYQTLKLPVKQSMETLYMDCYRSLGWEIEGMTTTSKANVSELSLKRDRRVNNRNEMRILHEKCQKALHTIEKLERSKKYKGTISALLIGIVSISFLVGAIFSFLSSMILLCVIFAIFGFVGFALSRIFYTRINAKQEVKRKEQIALQHEIINEVCSRSHALREKANKNRDN